MSNYQKTKLVIQCPSDKCRKNGVAKQWYKSDCLKLHEVYLDTDIELFCNDKCNWNGGKQYIALLDVSWNCSECKCTTKQSAQHVRTTISIAIAKLGNSINADRRSTYCAVLMKLAEKLE